MLFALAVFAHLRWEVIGGRACVCVHSLWLESKNTPELPDTSYRLSHTPTTDSTHCIKISCHLYGNFGRGGGKKVSHAHTGRVICMSGNSFTPPNWEAITYISINQSHCKTTHSVEKQWYAGGKMGTVYIRAQYSVLHWNWVPKFLLSKIGKLDREKAVKEINRQTEWLNELVNEGRERKKERKKERQEGREREKRKFCKYTWTTMTISSTSSGVFNYTWRDCKPRQ